MTAQTRNARIGRSYAMPPEFDYKGYTVKHRGQAFWVGSHRFPTKEEALLYIDY